MNMNMNKWVIIGLMFAFTYQADAGLKIYYIRHAQTGKNVLKRWEKKDVPKSEWPAYVGNSDVFTPAGEQQLAAATEKLQTYHSTSSQAVPCGEHATQFYHS